MKRIITGFVTYRHEVWQAEPEINFFTFDPRESDHMTGYVVVKEQAIEIEVPDDFDPRPDLIAGLKAQQQKARADFEKLKAANAELAEAVQAFLDYDEETTDLGLMASYDDALTKCHAALAKHKETTC